MADKVYHTIKYSGGLSTKSLRGNLVLQEGCITRYTWYSITDPFLRRGVGESYEDYTWLGIDIVEQFQKSARFCNKRRHGTKWFLCVSLEKR